MKLAVSSLDLPQSGIAYTEMMRYLMPHHSLNLSYDFTIISTPSLDWLLENGYLIRWHEPVATPTPCLRDTLIQAEEGVAMPYPRVLQLSLCWQVPYHDVNVVQSSYEISREIVNSFCY